MLKLPDKLMNSDLFLVVVSILKITSFASLLLTSGSLFIYSVGYAFLYGYYFSGELEQTNTWLEIVTVIVPFPFYSVLIVSSIGILSLFYIFHIIKLLKSKQIKDLFIFIILWLFLNILLTIIFTGAITPTNLLYLSLFWIFPAFLTIMIAILIKIAMREMFLSIVSALLYGFIINYLIKYFFKEEFFIFTVFFLLFLFSTKFFSNKKFFIRFIKILPIVVLANSIFIYNQDSLNISVPNKVNLLILILTTIIFSYSYAKIYPRFWLESEIVNPTQNYAQANKLEINNFIMHLKKKTSIMVPLLTILTLLFVVIIPLISKEIGKLMRTVTPDTSLKYELIHSSYSQKPIEGILVIDKNEILYISTREAQLIRIKDEKYRTEPVQ